MAPPILQTKWDYDIVLWFLLNRELSVLNSSTAIKVNIQIIRVFTKIRETFRDNLNIKLEIEENKKKLSHQNKNIELVFGYLDKLLEKKETQKPRRKIGFKN